MFSLNNLFLNLRKILEPEDIFSQLSVESLKGGFCLKSFTFCLYFILHLHVWIRIHKAPEYGSGYTTLVFPRRIKNKNLPTHMN